MASTFPKPQLYINIRDNGTGSISDVEDIDVVDVNSAEEMKDLILWLHKQGKKLKYKSIVLDTLTQFQQILVEEICEKKSLGKGKTAGDFGTMTMQEWGMVAGDLKSLIMDIRNLDVDVCFIAQERKFNVDDEESDGYSELLPEVGNRLMPSVNSDLNASVTIVGNTFIRVKVTKKKIKTKKRHKIKTTVEKLYCLRVGPNEVFTTKIRKPKGVEAPDYIVDPTFRKIQDVMKGKG